MRAIITRQNQDGSYDEVGMANRIYTGTYKYARNLIQYAIPKHFQNKNLRVEIYYTPIQQDKPDLTVFIP